MDLQIINDSPVCVIEVIVHDAKRRIKKAYMAFDMADDWYNEQPHEIMDLWGFFGSGIMAVVKRDKSAIFFESFCYRLINGEKKSAISFSPMMRVMGEFKPCLLKTDGTVEML